MLLMELRVLIFNSECLEISDADLLVYILTYVSALSVEFIFEVSILAVETALPILTYTLQMAVMYTVALLKAELSISIFKLLCYQWQKN